MALKQIIPPKVFIERVEEAISSVNSFVGESYIVNARSTDTYKDRTANLRNSIGFGKVDKGSISESVAGGQLGGPKAKDVISDAAASVKEQGLIMVAGMGYALFVESKGFDVISNSVEIAKKQHQVMMQNVLSNLAK